MYSDLLEPPVRKKAWLKGKLLEFCNLFEMLLAMESWLSMKEYPELQLKKMVCYWNALYSPVEYAICKGIEQFKKTVDRQEGNGVKIPKVHGMVHCPTMVISKFGAPSGSDTGPRELLHKDYSKRTANKTQKHYKTINQQTAQCYYENHIVDVAYSNMYKTSVTEDGIAQQSMPNSVGGAHFTIHVSVFGYHN